MAVTIDTTSSGGTGSVTASSATWSHVMGSVANGYIEVTVAAAVTATGSGTPITATYDGHAMTEIGHSTGSFTCSVWVFRYTAPASGSKSIVVSTNGAVNLRFGCTAVSYAGVDQTTPVAGSGFTASPTAGQHITQSPTSSAGQLITVHLAKRDTTEAPSADDTQDALTNTTNATPANNIYSGMSHAAGGTATVGWDGVAWNVNRNANQGWVTLNAAATGTTVTPGVLALTTATFAPTVSVSDNKSVTPGVLALALSTFAPTVTATANQTVTPGVLALLLSAFAPAVTISDNKVVTPDALALLLAFYAPTVTATTTTTTTGSPRKRAQPYIEPYDDDEMVLAFMAARRNRWLN